VMLPRASHILTTDQPEASHRAVLAFLREVSEYPAADAVRT
jgi:hypothetical protein